MAPLAVFQHIDVRHYRIESEVPVGTLIDELSDSPLIEFVEPNFIRRRAAIPSDPRFSEQWSLHNTGQISNGAGGVVDIDIDWPEAMDKFSGTNVVTVAVIDSGVALDHPEILPKLWINEGESDCLSECDGIDSDGNGYIDDLLGWDFVDSDPLPLDENGHGTLVASIIAASQDNSAGGVGISPTAQIMALRIANDFGQIGIPVSRFLSSTTYAAEKGAHIINASFGGGSYSSSEVAQVDWLDNAGVLLVAAAGNGGIDGIGDNNDSVPTYPASYPQNNIISVAATDRSGNLTSFSNFGLTSVDIAAPGLSIFGADVDRNVTYVEDFESGAPGWTQEQLPGSLSNLAWSLWTDGFGNTWAADSVGAFGEIIPYQPFTDSVLTSPLLTLSQLGPQLTFNVYYETEFLYDWLYVEISEDGVNWFRLDYATGFCLSCSPVSGVRVAYDASLYAGLSGYIRFRLVSDGIGQYDGVYVDNIELTEITTFEYDGSEYLFNDGTSFSAPILSGIAALVWSQYPSLTHHQVREIVIEQSDSYEALSGKVAGARHANANVVLSYTIADFDEDGLENGKELESGTGIDNADSDGDALTDGDEVNIFGTSPVVLDSDGDGLLDGDEVNDYGTNPARQDTDGDSISDFDEIALGLNPLDPNDCPVELCPVSSTILKLLPFLNEEQG